MLEDSKEENASLEAESQRYVNMIRSIKWMLIGVHKSTWKFNPLQWYATVILTAD